MQSASAEETIERLIFSLSELEQLGETIISGRGNFSVLSRTYLRMILGTLRATRGAILLFHPTENQLSIEESIGVREASMVIPITSDEISTILQFSIIDWSNVPSILEPLLKHIQPQLKALDANFWAPLKIRDEFLGVISLGPFLTGVEIEAWDRELLNVLANQTSIAIAYSRMLDEARAEKFRFFTLSDMATQFSRLVDTESLEEELVNYAVVLLDASAGALLLIHPLKQRLEMRYLFQFNTELKDLSIPLEANGDENPVLPMLREVMIAQKARICTDEEITALFGGRNLLAVPMRGREGMLGVLVVGDKEERGNITPDFTEEDGLLLEAFASQASVAIENARLYQEALERRRLQAEMEEAAKIQKMLIPDTDPEIPGYEVNGYYQPRGDVGGDYFDYIHESDELWGLAIADVSGKGMQAALLMATLRAGLRSEITRQGDLKSMALALNSLLYASSAEGKYATFFYAQLHPATGLLTSLHAGHNYPLIIHHDGSHKWLGMKTGGVPLGMFPNDMLPQISEYELEVTQLVSGDVVLFYTDGVTETVNLDDEYYGEERLEEAAKRLRHKSAKGIRKGIYNSIMEFQGEAQQFDDLTLMILKKK
ncbi:SpoIIE family protein phosphatase [Candidatus Poribacteria bacterium]|nr:SpoIIE family protein phosphatase [Candidatus Poribacteria bacterium]